MNSSRFILSVLSKFEKNNIKYAVLRKAEEVEQGIAHDIDITVDFTRITDVMHQLNHSATEMGWKRILVCEKDEGNLRTIHYAFNSEDKPQIVHFDLFKAFSWNGLVIIANQNLLYGTYKSGQVWCVSRSNEVVIKLLSTYIYHGYIKEEYKEDIAGFCQENYETFVEQLSTCIGSDIAAEIATCAADGNWAELESKKNRVRESVKHKHKAGKFSKVKSVLFKLNRYIHAKGVLIAFLGTDGSGKSTIIENIPRYLKNTFDETQIKYYHWRPGFIKSPKGEKSGTDVTDPHKQKPYGKILSFLKFMYFNMDYILGYWFSVRLHLGKNELVIFDRYYYDYMLDKCRYRLDISDSIIIVMKRFIPKPNIAFLLVGDPKVLYMRKKELPIIELKNQVEKIKKVSEIIPNSYYIDVNKSIDAVVVGVSNRILEFMSDREAKNQ